MGANDHQAIFVRGKALAAGFCGALFHGRPQSNAFNRADFRKAGLAQDEARFPVGRFCFGMLGIYHIFSGLPRHPDEGGTPRLRRKRPGVLQTVDAIPAIAKLPYRAKREEAA